MEHTLWQSLSIILSVTLTLISPFPAAVIHKSSKEIMTAETRKTNPDVYCLLCDIVLLLN